MSFMLGVVYLITMIMRRFCCKEQERQSLDPFHTEAWILQAEKRYNKILKDSPEATYSKTINPYDQDKCVICLTPFAKEQR
jgi:hypothetical protein